MNVIENLQILLAAVEAQPEKLFNLESWRQEAEVAEGEEIGEADCGTCFCVAGLACSMPQFQALGMKWNEHWGEPTFEGRDMWSGGGDTLFGAKSMSLLFRTSGNGDADAELGLPYTSCEWGIVEMECTDKELAVARIKHRIATLQAEAK